MANVEGNEMRRAVWKRPRPPPARGTFPTAQRWKMVRPWCRGHTKIVREDRATLRSAPSARQCRDKGGPFGALPSPILTKSRPKAENLLSEPLGEQQAVMALRRVWGCGVRSTERSVIFGEPFEEPIQLLTPTVPQRRAGPS